jgi:hypothetical protein
MGQFQFEWWNIDIREATGRITLEIKAKNKDGAIKQIKRYAKKHDEEVQVVRPDFHTEIYWDTLTLNRKGYQRRF